MAMEVYRRYEQTIKEWSASLSWWHGTLYCLAICVRTMPLYEEFVRRESWGEVAAFTLTHQFLRVALVGDPLDLEALARCRSRVEEFTPDTEEHTDADFACDVGIVHQYALRCLDDYKSEWVHYVARYCYELADAMTWRAIQPGGGIITPELEQCVEEHPLIQNELRRQTAIREQIAVVTEGSIASAEAFLARQQNFEDFLTAVPGGSALVTDRRPEQSKQRA